MVLVFQIAILIQACSIDIHLIEIAIFESPKGKYLVKSTFVFLMKYCGAVKIYWLTNHIVHAY